MAEHLAWDVGGVLAAAALLALLFLSAVLLRRWLLQRSGGTVECSLRTLPQDGAPGPWRLGLARYRGDELHWHRVFDFRLRPRQVIGRRGLIVSNRRRPDPGELPELGADAGIVEVHNKDLRVELAMGQAALTGFLAWLEAAPPGFPVDISKG
ncbi:MULTISPECIES: DUF2550 domain-containing protein [Thermomonospora]|uniref:DUF2550 domain-containing protein n=1 Tax=Thermomonospora curvata (strain ATCC 19995 / DSM 43183 / JCM 3096 / KCTC 9072 / NBRC 15933 / NCIMB 10081 / Henssen B9) TaxID=471852 RepID=D1AE17_THECD|nr:MULTISPECIES: DUF2550 domain-containing protein [Thermomonospora]ACY99443.1 hypothetical protein Tcur_3914 [Thermomonospora curvata DSM 43183]PKK12486.1 MAG: DUF2550 domain-containing protein [Thermomonospora sp. CIF 1]